MLPWAIFLKRILILISLVLFSNVLLADNFTWRSNASNSSWEDPLNWSGTTAVPVNGSNQVVFRSSDNITIGTTSIAPVLNSNQTIGSFSISVGNLTISQGIILNVTGGTTIASGTTIFGTGQLNCGTTSAAVSISIGNATAGAIIHCNVYGNANDFYLRNNTFNSSTNFKVTSNGVAYNIGGNYFNGVTSFESATTQGVRLSDVGEDHFNNDLTLISTINYIYASYNYSTAYGGNIVVKSIGSGVYFGNSAASSSISSTLALGKTITAVDFTLGSLILKNFKQLDPLTSQNITLGGTNTGIVFVSGTNASTPQTVFEGEIIVNAPSITLNGAEFKKIASFSATLPTTSIIGNIYNNNVTFNYNINNVNATWAFDGDQFKADALFNNFGTGIISLGNNGATNFDGNVTFDNKSSGQFIFANNASSIVNFNNTSGKVKFINRGVGAYVKMCNNGTVNFNSNIEVSTTANSNIYSVYTGNGKVYLKDGRTISVGDLGFTGVLAFKNFIQQGLTSQTIQIPCSYGSYLYFQTGCDWSGNLTVEVPILVFQGGIFRGTSDFSICYTGNATTMTSINYEPVVFKGDTHIRHKSTSTVTFGSGTSSMIFEGNTNFYITNMGHMYLAYVAGHTTIFSNPDKKVSVNISSINNAGAGSFYFAGNGVCQIKSNIEVSNNANASIVIGPSLAGSVTLDEGKIISIPPGAFSYGSLNFKNFEQLGNTPQNLLLSGSAYVVFSSGTIFNGDLTAVSPRLYMASSKFKGVSYFEKTGGLIDNNDGTNEFYKKTTFKNSGSNYMLWCYNTSSSDHFYDDVVYWNTSSGGMYPAYNGTTQFDGNILFKNTGSGSIYVGNNLGISTIANGKAINVEDFTSSGGLSLRYFKQQDPLTPQNIILSSTGTGFLTLGLGVEFSGQVTASAPNFSIGGTYGGISSFTKTGTANSSCLATSYFAKDVTFTNLSNNSFYVGGGTNWTFDGNVTFNNINSTGNFLVSNNAGGVTNFNGIGKLIKFNNSSGGFIYISNNGICNFNSDIELSNPLNGAIYFAVGVTNGGIVNLSANTHLNVTNYNSGMLSFRGTKQAFGSPNIELDLSGSRLNIDAGSEFYSNLKITTSLLSLSNSKFRGVVDFTVKNNILNNNSASSGGSIFYSDFTAINEGVQSLGFNGDIYMGSATFIKKNTGGVYPSNQGVSEYYGNINHNVIGPYALDAFGYFGGGTSVFKGSASQVISTNSSSLTFWGGIKLDKESNHVTSNTSINSTGPVTFVKGNLIISSNNYFSFSSNTQIVTGGADQSYIQGVARRFGSTAFTFPVGNGGKYMPLSISAPSSNEDIRVEAFLATPPNATTLNNTLSRVSSCQYWNVQRVTGSSNVSLTIPWTSSGCEGVNTRDISVAQYKNNVWQFFGANNKVVDGSSGSITSNAPFTSGYYTLGYVPFDESIFGILSNKMDGSVYPVKGQKINFRFLEQYKDAGSLKYKIYSNPSEIKKEGSLSTNYGQNYESIELQTLGLIDGKLYILEVTDEKNRKSYLKFEYKNN